MRNKQEKRLIIIGISRKGEKGFSTIKKEPGNDAKEWPGSAPPVLTGLDEKRASTFEP